MTPKEAFAAVLKDLDISVQQANNGYCQEVAEAVAKKLDGAIVCSVEEGSCYHFFIKYHGKYYDADYVEGVKTAIRITYHRGCKPKEKRVGKIRVWGPRT